MKNVSSAHITDGFGKVKKHAPPEHVYLHQDIGHIRENHLQATLLPQLSSTCTQAESTDIAHDMFRQIKMKIPWYNGRHTLITRKKGLQTKNDRWPASLLLCVLGSTNSASLQTPLILCFKSAVNSCIRIVRPV